MPGHLPENELNSLSKGLDRDFPYIKVILLLGAAAVMVALAVIFRDILLDAFDRYYVIFSDSRRTTDFIQSFGISAPIIFILFQIFQVILAPFPGEATGFIGGYLFGAAAGFFYSTIGLTIGSWVNLLIGRYFGKRVVRRIISRPHLEKFDRVLKHQGVIIFFILFIIPGFPKDYLCLFLGLSSVSLKLLILIAGVGRLPGTLILSLQGDSLFDRNYVLTTVLLIICLITGIISYRYREKIYQWVERFNGKSG